MKEYLYRIKVRNRKTGEDSSIYYWSKNVATATNDLIKIGIIGIGTDLIWEETEFAQKDGESISREVDIDLKIEYVRKRYKDIHDTLNLIKEIVGCEHKDNQLYQQYMGRLNEIDLLLTYMDGGKE